MAWITRELTTLLQYLPSPRVFLGLRFALGVLGVQEILVIRGHLACPEKKENHLTWYCCKVKGSNLIYTMTRGFMNHIPTTSPFEPVSPSTPGFPGRPGDPGGPGSPLAPGGPVIPISPLSPLKPASPWKNICGYIWLIFIVFRGTCTGGLLIDRHCQL